MAILNQVIVTEQQSLFPHNAMQLQQVVEKQIRLENIKTNVILTMCVLAEVIVLLFNVIIERNC